MKVNVRFYGDDGISFHVDFKHCDDSTDGSYC